MPRSSRRRAIRVGDSLDRHSRVRDTVRLPIVVLFTTLAGPTALVSAHPAYEHTVRSLTDASGAYVDIVKSYIDGIVFTDPVKLVVRPRTGGAPVAETGFQRDVSLLCWSRSKCVAFGFDGFFPIWPSVVWHVSTNGLTRVEGRGIRLIGVLAPLWDHRLGYLLALVLLAVPAGLFKTVSALRQAKGYRAVVRVCAAVVGSGWLLLWGYAVILLSDLSFPLVLLLVALVIGLLRVWRKGAGVRQLLPRR